MVRNTVFVFAGKEEIIEDNRYTELKFVEELAKNTADFPVSVFFGAEREDMAPLT